MVGRPKVGTKWEWYRHIGILKEQLQADVTVDSSATTSALTRASWCSTLRSTVTIGVNHLETDGRVPRICSGGR